MAYFLLAVIGVTWGVAFGQTDCRTLSDGIYEIGCKVFDVCTNHVLKTIECQENYVYDNVTKSCRDQAHVLPPCGLIRDCSNKPDRRYVDILYTSNCTSYYTCNNHYYYGHNFCTPGTVFEETLQTCVWPVDAYPPCGTKAKK